MTHCRLCWLKPRSLLIEGSAMFRIEASRMSMNWTTLSRSRMATPRRDESVEVATVAGAGSFMSWASLSGDVAPLWVMGRWCARKVGRRLVATPKTEPKSLAAGAGSEGGDWSEARPARARCRAESPREPGRKRRRRRGADGDRGAPGDRQDRADGRDEVEGQRGRDACAQCARLGARACVLVRRRAPAFRAAARVAVGGGAGRRARRRGGAGRAALQPGAVQPRDRSRLVAGDAARPLLALSEPRGAPTAPAHDRRPALV